LCAPVKIEDLFKEVTNLIGDQFKRKNIKLEFDVAPINLTLFADREVLFRTMQNLLENSLAYTFEDGAVRLSANSRENFCEIRVKDTGQPVEKGFEEMIFTRY